MIMYKSYRIFLAVTKYEYVIAEWLFHCAWSCPLINSKVKADLHWYTLIYENYRKKNHSSLTKYKLAELIYDSPLWDWWFIWTAFFALKIILTHY